MTKISDKEKKHILISFILMCPASVYNEIQDSIGYDVINLSFVLSEWAGALFVSFILSLIIFGLRYLITKKGSFYTTLYTVTYILVILIFAAYTLGFILSKPEYLIIIALAVYILYIKKPELFNINFNKLNLNKFMDGEKINQSKPNINFNKLNISKFMSGGKINKKIAWGISFFIAVIYSVYRTEGNFSFINFIAYSLGVLLLPGILAWYLNKYRKWNFSKTLIIGTLIFCALSFWGYTSENEQKRIVDPETGKVLKGKKKRKR